METVKREGIDIVFAMDVSNMLTEDAESIRKTNRLFRK
jgi:hypothetical protein